MVITATVLRVDANGLLVRNLATGQEIFVHTDIASQFRVGDVVEIRYNGRMTHSNPPQIVAQTIMLASNSCNCRGSKGSKSWCFPRRSWESGMWPDGGMVEGSVSSCGCDHDHHRKRWCFR